MNSIRKRLAFACALGIAGCGQGSFGSAPLGGPGGATTLPPAARGALAPGHSPSGTVSPAIYLFKGQPDAANPDYGLVNVGNVLYGTTAAGGKHGLGAVYSVTTAGAETVLHSFNGGADGLNPDAALTNVNGTLYGTTYQAGTGHGTIFSIDSSGSYKRLYNCDVTSSDCTEPDSTMIYVASKNALYGTGHGCGVNGEGCIFKVGLGGKKPKVSVLYSFTGSASSSTAASGLVLYKDALYGTTPQGGANNDGAVFKVTLSGQESIVYSFKGGTDGRSPESSLVVLGAGLYGTTMSGGNSECGNFAGCGTVYKVSPRGDESVLYRFTDVASRQDGNGPQSALIAVNGMLYGTTPSSTFGAGTLYSVSPQGSETVLFTFSNSPSDPSGTPEFPFAPLLSLNGTLYGTTRTNKGSEEGTVFAVPQ